MKYLPLFQVLPAEIVKIIINFVKIHYKNVITYFCRKIIFKNEAMKITIRSLLWIEDYYTNCNKIKLIDFIINNNWGTYYNRYFWCCFTGLLANKIMRDTITLQMLQSDNIYKRKNLNYNLKIITKLWFNLCKKYNLVLNITFYNFRSKKADKSVILPAKNFIKPINNFNNILFSPIVEYNNSNNYYIITYHDILYTLNKYSR